MRAKSKAWQEEEICKEAVYTTLEQNVHRSEEDYESAQTQYEQGQYEDAQKSVMQAIAIREMKTLAKRKKQSEVLRENPYYAHIRLKRQDTGEIEEYFLSDSEELDESIQVGENAYIYPFRRNGEGEAPLAEELGRFLDAPDATPFQLSVLREGLECVITYYPILCRYVTIQKRNLMSVSTLLDVEGSEEAEEVFEADEMLMDRLEEYHLDNALCDRFSSLQQQQNDIILSDPKESFIVQGCAGSGSARCMLHRMFYLRECLGDEDWKRVMLIMPASVSREYSADLIRRFRLSDVANCSVEEFYCYLLQAYDGRFRNRQYMIELTEEYLPETYLKQVYSSDIYQTVSEEIRRAIHSYVEDACRILKTPMPEGEQVNSDFIWELLHRLPEEIRKVDSILRTPELAPMDSSREDQAGRLDEQLSRVKNQKKHVLDLKNSIGSDLNQMRDLGENIRKAVTESETFTARNQERINAIMPEMQAAEKQIDRMKNDSDRSSLTARYARLLYSYTDSTETYGRQYRKDAARKKELEDNILSHQETLKQFLHQEESSVWENRRQQRLEDLDSRLGQMEQQEKEVRDELTKYPADASMNAQRRELLAYRAGLEHAHYTLSHLESIVFEQDVSDILEPLKKDCSVQAVYVEKDRDGQQKQSRILYKSDLLYYLMIYQELKASENLPVYDWICVDEAQDLFDQDYRLLHTLYPDAVWNVYGDMQQILKTDCGIRNWKKDTGIDTLYTLESNYRNAPAIVDFCNTKFGTDIEYLGTVKEEEKPVLIRTNPELVQTLFQQDDLVIIVKDDRNFEMLRTIVQKSMAMDFIFLDSQKRTISAEEMKGEHRIVYSVFAARGLEFNKALVYAVGMTKKQKFVACTRVMENLFYYE